MSKFHKIYVILHPVKSEDEYQQKIKVILSKNLAASDKIEFIRLVDSNSVLFDFYVKDSNCDRSAAQILITHLQICRKICSEIPKQFNGSIILPDSVLLHENWSHELQRCLNNLPETANFLSFYYAISSKNHDDSLIWAGKASEANMCSYVPGKTLGCAAYWISKKQCSKVLSKVDRPFRLFAGKIDVNRIFSSLSSKDKNSFYISYPALAIAGKVDYINNEEEELNKLWLENHTYEALLEVKNSINGPGNVTSISPEFRRKKSKKSKKSKKKSSSSEERHKKKSSSSEEPKSRRRKKVSSSSEEIKHKKSTSSEEPKSRRHKVSSSSEEIKHKKKKSPEYKLRQNKIESIPEESLSHDVKETIFPIDTKTLNLPSSGQILEFSKEIVKRFVHDNNITEDIPEETEIEIFKTINKDIDKSVKIDEIKQMISGMIAEDDKKSKSSEI